MLASVLITDASATSKQNRRAGALAPAPPRERGKGMCKYCDIDTYENKVMEAVECEDFATINPLAEYLIVDTDYCQRHFGIRYCPMCGRPLNKTVNAKANADPMPKPQESYKVIDVDAGAEEEVTSWEAAIKEAKAVIEQHGVEYVEVSQLVGEVRGVRQAVWS